MPNIHEEIISYLNEATNKKYRSKTQKTIKFINARLNEGYELQDFKDVIDNRCKHWYGTNMSQYLRPETLFGNKFEGYLMDSYDSGTQEMSELDMLKMAAK